MRRVLAPSGMVLLVGGERRRRMLGPLGHILRVKLAAKLFRRKAGFFVAKPNREDLATLRTLVETGQVKPVIEQRYELAQIGEAMRAMGEGHARAKMVVAV
jgi:NADPH:quinone reductase-like Zn-dependent oxidoreductase